MTTEDNSNVEPNVEVTAEPTIQAAAPISFIDSLDEDLRGPLESKDFKDNNQLAKSYIELQRMVGNSVRIPAADASEEARNEFLGKIKDIDGVLLKDDEGLYNKLGRPETPDQYEFDEMVGLEGNEDAAQELTDFKTIAHEMGLSKTQAKKLIDVRLETVKMYQDQEAAHREAQKESLKATWGAEYDNRIHGAKQAADVFKEKYGDSMQDLIDGPAGNNPAFLQILSEVAKTFKEEGHVGMNGVEFNTTSHGALDKISAKQADPGFMKAYTDRLDPGHKRAVQEMNDLYRISEGG